MKLWSRLSALLWQEPEVDVSEPDAPARAEGAGIPGYARQAVRFAMIGGSALMLTAQVTGIRLEASVDAQPHYCITESQQCKAACPGPGETQAQCVHRCNEARKACERNP